MLHDIIIDVLMSAKEVTKCNYFGATLGAGESRRLPCPPETFGHSVRVSKDPKDKTMLILCEVEVYGTNGTYDYIIITRIVNSRELYKPVKRTFVLVIVLLRACARVRTRVCLYVHAHACVL